MRLIGKPLELTLNLIKNMKDDPEASVSIEVAMSLIDTIEALQQENEQLKTLSTNLELLKNHEQIKIDYANLYRNNRQIRERNTVIREILAKVLKVMEGFDYRANINFTLSDCLEVEKDAKALLGEGSV